VSWQAYIKQRFIIHVVEGGGGGGGGKPTETVRGKKEGGTEMCGHKRELFKGHRKGPEGREKQKENKRPLSGPHWMGNGK